MQTTLQVGTDLAFCRHLLTAGAVVAIPTETVYGLAGNALDPDAVAQIFAVKRRPAYDPLILHIDRLERLAEWVRHIPDEALVLARAFWPGPLTLLLPRRTCISDAVTAGHDTVAVRIPAHPLTLELLASLDFPLAAPSANPFGYISPTSPAHVLACLGDAVPYILDGGPCCVGVESTIVGFPDGRPTIYRLGGLTAEAIVERIGTVLIQPNSSSDPKAPGMLKSHYAPRTPLVLGLQSLDAFAGQRVGVLTLSTRLPHITSDRQIQLSPSGNLNEAARHLFGALRALDAQQLDVIFAELMPDEGLGRAMNDRLRRAAARRTAE